MEKGLAQRGGTMGDFTLFILIFYSEHISLCVFYNILTKQKVKEYTANQRNYSKTIRQVSIKKIMSNLISRQLLISQGLHHFAAGDLPLSVCWAAL